jgi:hypothetical protein
MADMPVDIPAPVRRTQEVCAKHRFWYAAAGELGTGAGAVGWFRVGQCYEFAGDRGRAVNAMGRCLELDGVAKDARTFIEAFGSWPDIAGLQ